jgi:archaellum component FlaC
MLRERIASYARGMDVEDEIEELKHRVEALEQLVCLILSKLLPVGRRTAKQSHRSLIPSSDRSVF